MALPLKAFYLGFSALFSQVVILREVSAQCGGTEIVYGMGLGTWLLAGAMGAIFMKHKRFELWKYVDLAAISIPSLSVLTLLAIRGLRPLWGYAPLETPPFGLILFSSTIPLVFPAMASGVMFRALSQLEAVKKGRRTNMRSSVFFFESTGSMAGGLVSLLGPVIRTDPFVLMAVVQGLAAFSSFAAIPSKPRRKTDMGQSICYIFVVIFFVILSPYLDESSSRWAFKGLGHTYNGQVVKGRFDATVLGGEKALYLNLVREFASEDYASLEEMVHLPASFSEHPKKFLLVGAHLLPLAGECEKYDPDRILVVDDDRLHAENVARLLGIAGWETLFKKEEPYRYLAKRDELYDLIVTSPGLPVTLASDRFMNLSFFTRAARSLSPRGVFFLRLPFGGEYLGDSYLRILRNVYIGLRRAFPSVRVVPGEEFSFLATPSPDRNLASPSTAVRRLADRKLTNRYFVPQIALYRLDEEREKWALELLGDENSDISGKKLTVADGMEASFSLHRGIADRMVVALIKGGYVVSTLLFIILNILLFSLFFRKSTLLPSLSIYLAGVSGMLTEILLIFGYQIAFGDIFVHVGLLFCSYMAGLALGSSGLSKNRTIGTMLFLGGISLSMIVTMASFAARGIEVPRYLFILSLLLTGAGGGAIYSHAGAEMGSYSRAYALDLAGASAAAFAGSSLLIPILGPLWGASLVCIATLFSLLCFNL